MVEYLAKQRKPYKFALAWLPVYHWQTYMACHEVWRATARLYFMAPPQGLEPWTYGLTVRRSNQLS